VTNNPSPTTWKNPTAYTPLSVLYQQYYGGPTTVPLYAAPSHWVLNPGEVNQAGQYVETNSAEADLYPYDGGSTFTSYSDSTISYSDSAETYIGSGTVTPVYEYDSTDRNYDGVNDGLSFYSWKNATDWTPLTGGNI